MSTFFRRLFSTSSTQGPAMEKAQQLISDNPVMVFSKTWCPYCRRAKQILSSFDAQVTVYELDKESDGSDVQSALADLTGQTTVPNIFIASKHIGGCDDLTALAHNNKQFLAQLRDAGALPGQKPAAKPADKSGATTPEATVGSNAVAEDL